MTSAILFAIPDLGAVIVRIASIFALFERSVLATGLVLISMILLIIPLLAHSITALRARMGRTSGGDRGIEPGDVVE